LSRSSWKISYPKGSVAELHQLEPDFSQRGLLVCPIEKPTLVLGSGQNRAVAQRAEQMGLEIVKRRSGGAAVLLQAEDVLWVDVLLPQEDSLWLNDVGRATWWLGEVWAQTLKDLGLDAEVHRQAMRPSEWSGEICFAGLGPGEVTVGGHKVVGVSQRRTRQGARFQCAALLAWQPQVLVEAFCLPKRAVNELNDLATGLNVSAQDLLAAFLRRLP
jgi:lipoate-protein ligase A